jgi:hypothetical protein
MALGSFKPACPFCGNVLSRKLKAVRESYSNTYSIFFCEQCAIGITLPVPSLAELNDLYASESYRTASGVRFNKLLEDLVYLFRLGEKTMNGISKGRILDIGCGRGLFLARERADGRPRTESMKRRLPCASRAFGLDVKRAPSAWLPDEL